MTKIENLRNQLNGYITTMQAFLDDNKLDEAKGVKAQIEAIKEQIAMQAFLDEAEQEKMKNKTPTPQFEDKSEKENATFIRAAIKKMTGRPTTEVENALLLPTTSSPNGANGEGYILPQDIRTQINKRVRDFKSFRDVLGSITTTCLTGSFVYEDIENLAGLVDFSDGSELAESEDPKFTQVKFSLSEKGAIIYLSNVLLSYSDADLVAYIVDYFAKKAVITENTLAIEALKKGKTVKTLDDYKALRTSINVDLDPMTLNNTVIVTNQDGFDYLDSLYDDKGRPLLQPDLTQPSVYRFKGFRVEQYSNAQLPSTTATSTKAGYAPIFYGNLSEAVKFVDGEKVFATSKEAGFTKNVTMARLIELVDVVQCDSSDKCYIYGQLKVAEKTGA